MTKILCSLSGIEYNVDHFRLYLQSRESYHPIFNLSAPALINLAPKWINQEFTDTENYLYYLSLFKSTGLIEFRVPAMFVPPIINPIIAQNMHRLIAMVEKLIDASDARKQEILHLPTLIITPDTKDLSDSGEWIKIWENCYKSYLDSYKTATALEKLQRKESILERHIKDRTKDISTYAHQLASWAAQAGQFPDFDAGLDKSILNGQKMSLSSYWQHIIRSCAKMESIWDIPKQDIQELIEHCEDSIEHGSIYAHTLMALLHSGLEKKNNFINLGDINIGINGAATFRILDASASIEDANKLASIDSAPATEPRESEYPNKLAFIKAKMNWKMKMDYQKSLEQLNQNDKDKGE